MSTKGVSTAFAKCVKNRSGYDNPKRGSEREAKQAEDDYLSFLEDILNGKREYGTGWEFFRDLIRKGRESRDGDAGWKAHSSLLADIGEKQRQSMDLSRELRETKESLTAIRARAKKLYETLEKYGLPCALWFFKGPYGNSPHDDSVEKICQALKDFEDKA